MKILVIGYGVSGQAASAFLRHRGHEVGPVDKKGGEGVLLDAEDLPLEGFDQVILSPGIPQTHPLVQKALALGIEVIAQSQITGYPFTAADIADFVAERVPSPAKATA